MKSLAFRFQHKQIYHTLHNYLMLIYAFDALSYVKSQSAANHLELANRLLSTGRYTDALSHFHEALHSDPSNYLTYFKRATVFLALNRPKSALEDLDKALELNNDFTSALDQRASLHLKLGNLDEAQIDFERVLAAHPSEQKARAQYQKIDALKSAIEDAKSFVEDDQHDKALPMFNTLIETIPWNTELLTMRAAAFEKVGETRRAIIDYRNVAKLSVDAKVFLNIAKLYHSLGEMEESLNSVRECLKLDPDDKACMNFYKPTKKLNNHIKSMIESKESKDNDECHSQGQNALELMKEHTSPLANSVRSVMCHCLSRAGDTIDGMKVCDEALNNSEGLIVGIAIERWELLCDKAELLADIQEYAEALKLYQESQKIHSNKRAKKGIDKMNKIKKQQSKRDYYRILGVNRSAGENEISKAYRKLAAKWHPDRFQDEQGKKKAQAKFMDIADAKAVLTDPEKRRMYDQGDDPLDPETKHGSSHQQGFYSDQFQHFGGGSPFQFKFNFG